MSFAGNILWFLFGFGWLWGTLYLIIGLLYCCTVVGIPFGVAIFRLARFMYFPFGKELVDARDVGEKRLPGTDVAEFFWVMLIGTGSAVGFVGMGIGYCVCLITIPFGLAYFKLAKPVFNPMGKRVVPTEVAQRLRARQIDKALDAMEDEGGKLKVAGGFRLHIILAIILSFFVGPFIWAGIFKVLALPFRGEEVRYEQTGAVRSGWDGTGRPSGIRVVDETPAKPLTEASEVELRLLAQTISKQLHAGGISATVKELKVVRQEAGAPNTYLVQMTYSEPLYSVGDAQKGRQDRQSGMSIALGGEAFRLIRQAMPAGTPVPTLLTVRANGRYALQAEGVENPTFPSGFAKRFDDAALVPEGSQAHKTLEHILDRALLVARQLKADGAARKGDPVAAQRYKNNLRLLDKDLPRAVAAVLREHNGKVLETLPASWGENFGEVASEQAAANAAIDTAALLKDVNRRFSIAGSSVALTACEVLSRAETAKTTLYQLRVKANQAVWNVGERASSMRSETNRQLRVSLPGHVFVARVAAAGEPFGLTLELNNAQQRNPDGFELAIRAEGKPVFEETLRAENKARLILVAGSPAEAALREVGQRLLALEQALYEDKNQRRSNAAAKARYEANDKAQRAALKALSAYAKERRGQILADLPGLPRVPDPKK